MLPRIPSFKPEFGREEEEAVMSVVRSGWIAQERQVNEFEGAVAEDLGIDSMRVVAVSSGTAALHIALILAGIKKGDEVLVPSLGFIATANAVTYCGADPIFVDVDRWMHTSAVNHFEARLTPRTRAIIPVHIYGRMAPMDLLSTWARNKGLVVIEDAAPAFGASLRGRKAGIWGDLACFSLHSAKPFTTGEGGIVIVGNASQSERARRLRSHGASVWDYTRIDFSDYREEQYVEMGFNYRLTDLQAAIGRVQLGRLLRLEEKRRRIFGWYNTRLADERDALYLPPEEPTATPSSCTFLQYVVGLKSGRRELRDEIIRKGRTKGMYLVPGGYLLPMQPMWPSWRREEYAAKVPNALFASASALGLPTYPGMSEREVGEVCGLIKRFLS